MSTPIETLRLSSRPYNALLRSEIDTVEKLRRVDFSLLRDIGPKSAKEIAAALATLPAAQPEPVNLLKELTPEEKITCIRSLPVEIVDEKMTAADSEKFSLLSVGEQFRQETDALAEYEGHKTLARAIDKAIEYCRSMASFVKGLENRPSSQP
jgi:hypothetical protein